VIESGYTEGEHLPFCTARSLSMAERLRLRMFGTPHHLEAGRVPGP
jgi:hypothetical protein